jgi:multicomponent Na+:H+ antiporter subunit E
MNRLTGNATARTIAVRSLLLGLVWWVVTEGDRAALGIGVPVVAVAVFVSLALGALAPVSVSPIGLVRLAVFFLVASLRGGIDVAARALSPRMPLDPGFVQYRVTLPHGPARIVFMIALSLTPGTLTVEPEGEAVCVHALVAEPAVMYAQIAALERYVAGALRGKARGPEPGHG